MSTENDEKGTPIPPVKVGYERVNKIMKGRTTKQKKFIKAVAQGMGSGKAVVAAGYDTKSLRNAKIIGSQLMANEKVMTSLNAYLDELYPTLNDDAAIILRSIVDEAKQPEATMKQRLDALKMLRELRGWDVARKTTKMVVNPTDFFKPPK